MSDSEAVREVELTPEIGEKIVQNALELLIIPEIERRQESGELPESFDLQKAQVIWRMGEGNEVRLNDEVRVGAYAKVEADGPIERGQKLELSPDQLDELVLTEEDADAAHITMLRYGNRVLVDFDFRYNAALIEEHIAVARQFLDCAKRSLDAGQVRPAVANLFSAMELAVMGTLLQLPDKPVLTSRSHNYRRSQFNLWHRDGAVETKFVELFNRLYDLRDQARYPHEGGLDLDLPEAREMAETATAFCEKIESGIPERTSSIDPSEVQATD